MRDDEQLLWTLTEFIDLIPKGYFLYGILNSLNIDHPFIGKMIE